MPPYSGQVFHAACSLSLEPLGDYVAVFSPADGETHVLDAFPAEVLALISEQSLSPAQIEATMASRFGGDTAEWRTPLETSLHHLRDLGLVIEA